MRALATLLGALVLVCGCDAVGDDGRVEVRYEVLAEAQSGGRTAWNLAYLDVNERSETIQSSESTFPTGSIDLPWRQTVRAIPLDDVGIVACGSYVWRVRIFVEGEMKREATTQPAGPDVFCASADYTIREDD